MTAGEAFIFSILSYTFWNLIFTYLFGVRTMATEKRLIDANELLKRENEAYLVAKRHPSASAIFTIIHKSLQDLLNQAPTVDAVEVVRCKDCKKWFRHTQVDRERGDCRRYQTTKHELGFCDRGERVNNV